MKSFFINKDTISLLPKILQWDIRWKKSFIKENFSKKFANEERKKKNDWKL